MLAFYVVLCHFSAGLCVSALVSPVFSLSRHRQKPPLLHYVTHEIRDLTLTGEQRTSPKIKSNCTHSLQTQSQSQRHKNPHILQILRYCKVSAGTSLVLNLTFDPLFYSGERKDCLQEHTCMLKDLSLVSLSREKWTCWITRTRACKEFCISGQKGRKKEVGWVFFFFLAISLA